MPKGVPIRTVTGRDLSLSHDRGGWVIRNECPQEAAEGRGPGLVMKGKPPARPCLPGVEKRVRPWYA
jgi:hypothetical protein